MYCRKCGNKLEDDALFCPECGTKVDREGMNQDVNSNADAPHYQNAASGQNNMGAGNATGDNNNEKINWREYLTMENIERFAPIAALLPIGMAVGCCFCTCLISFQYIGKNWFWICYM